MVLSFIIAAASPVIATITIPAVPNLQQAYMVMLAALSIAFLAWHAPGIAAGMVSGGPTLTAGAAAGFVASSAFGAFAGAAAASSAARTTAAGTLGAASAQLGGSGAAGQAAAAVTGGAGAFARSTAEAASRPIRNAGSSIAEAYKRGEVRAWKPRSATPATPPAGSSSGSASQDLQSAMRAANTIRSVIPPEGASGPGMSAPIRPTE
jgi:type IV secretion system protein TrbL